jgi:ribosomal protein S18 acetylase RimI-like enzyme
MSEKDRQMVGGKAHVIPNGVDLERFTATQEAPGHRILFIGSFRHFPNVSAFQWFWDQVWPQLKQCELTVVAGPEPLDHWRRFSGQRELPQHPRLDLRGFVADVKPLYDQANVVIVPTLVSAGTNLKLLEAMAMRRAVVSTTSGCAGLGLVHGESVLVADSPDEFRSAVATLLDNAPMRERLAGAAREIAERNFSWRSLGTLQRDLWNQFSPAPLRIDPQSCPEPEFSDYPAFVARVKGEVAGYLAWRAVAPEERELLWLYTMPGWRRQGIAARLLEWALAHEPARWFLEVRPTNEEARRLYQRLGFEEIGIRKGYYSDPPEDAILMQRG